jgi:hypothetical protein
MVALLISLLAWPPPQHSGDYPRPDEFARVVREGLQLDDVIQRTFSYVERRRDVRISKLGKVTIGPLRAFEVHASENPGQPYKRLIEVDGKPLTPAELARRDAEHQRDLVSATEQQRKEIPSEQAERLKEAEDERRRRQAILDDAFAVFRATFVGREAIEGRPILVADLAPRPNARVSTREGRWMAHFRGRVWVDETNGQVVKLDMRAFEDVTIGWGIVGRAHEGSSLYYQRRQVDGIWVPAELTYRASGRTLLFRPFEFEVTTTYSDFRRR